MNDEQITQIYNEGNAESHTAGLRKVYEAGQKHDAWVIEDRRLAEDARVAAAQSRLNEEARIDAEKAAAEAKKTPAQRKLDKDLAAAEETRVATAAKVAEEKRKSDEKVAAEDAKREAARIAALKPDVAVTGAAAVPTKAQIAAVRKAAAEKVKGEHLSAANLDAVQDEAEAELVARMARGEAVDV